MDIQMIYTEREKTDVTHADCIYCMKCIEACPEPDALMFTMLGKLCTLAILGGLSAWLGSTVLTKVQDIYPNVTKWVFRALLAGTGSLILFRLLHKPSCEHCKSCKTDRTGKILSVSYPLAGAVYAAIPCAPLVLALGYAATMAPIPAIMLMVGFGIANSFVPMLLYASLTGVVIRKLKEEAPGIIKYIQYAAVAVLLILAILL